MNLKDVFALSTNNSEIGRNTKDEHLFRLNEEILKIIELIQFRSTSYENRRNIILSLAITITGVGITVLAIYPIEEFEKGVWLQAPVICLIMGSICIFTLYFLQSKVQYPFDEYIENWRWIYHDIVDSEVPTGPLVKADRKSQSRKILERDLNIFISRTMNSSIEELLKQNLQELYILHVYERYKIMYYKQLIKILAYILAITFVLFLLSSFINSGPELLNLLFNTKISDLNNKEAIHGFLVVIGFIINPIVLGIELYRSRT